MRPGIDSEDYIAPAYVAWRAGTTNRVIVPARQAENRFLGSLKICKYGLWILKMFKFHESCLATVYSPVVVAVVVDRPMAVKHQPILTGLQGLGPY